MTKFVRFLVLAVVIVSLAGLPLSAAALSLHKTVTARDFSVSYNDKTYDFGLGGSVDANMDLDQGEASVRYELTGDGLIGGYQAVFKDDALTLWADGLSSAYTIRLDDLKNMIALSGDSFDLDAYMGMMKAYMRLLGDMSDPEVAARIEADIAAWSAAFFADIATVYPDPETIKLGGVDRVMQRVRLTFNGQQMDEFMSKVSSMLPSLGEFIDQYIAFFASVDPELAAKLPAERPYVYGDMRKLTAMDVLVRMDVWTDETGAARAAYDFVFAADQGGQVRLFSMPMQLDVYPDGNARVTEMSMNTDIDGQNVVIGVYASEQETEQSFSASVGIDMTDNTSASVVVNGLYSAPGDGTELLHGMLSITDPSGEFGSFTVDYEGTLEETELVTQREGRVRLGLYAPVYADRETEYGELAFTLSAQTAPFDPAALNALDDLPAIPMLEITEEQLAALAYEGKLIGIRAMGGLLKAPGIAELLSELMTESGESAFYFDMNSPAGAFGDMGI